MSIIAALISLLLQAAAPQATASIEGVVVKAGSNEPLAGVSVELSRAAGAPAGQAATVITADDGRFVFRDVAAGSYRLVATRGDSQYAPAEFGQREPGGRGLTIDLGSGQRMMNARLEMAPTGSIGGRVFDADGEPLANARVMALNSVYRDGRRLMNIVEAVRTNDQGEYRLFWLMPGRYYVGVIPQDLRSRAFSVYVTTPGRYGSREDASSPVIVRSTQQNGETIEETWMPVYYGGGLDEQRALPVDVRAAAHTGAVDVSVANARLRSSRIRGTVVNSATGQPAPAAVVKLVPQRPAAHLIVPNGTADKAGVFDFGGVTPGKYWLVAALNPARGVGQGESFFDVSAGSVAMIPFEAGERDMQNITLTLRPAFSITGRLVADAAGSPVDLTRVRVRLLRDPDTLGLPNSEPRGTPNAPANGVPAADGAFSLRGISAGDYRIELSGLPETTYIKSIRLGSADVLAGGLHIEAAPGGILEVIVAANAASIDGAAVNVRQEPAANVTAVLVPELPLRGRADLYKSAFTDGAGRFRLTGIPPGDYELFVWEAVETGAWQDPAFMRGFEGKGQRVHLSESGRSSVRAVVQP